MPMGRERGSFISCRSVLTASAATLAGRAMAAAPMIVRAANDEEAEFVAAIVRYREADAAHDAIAEAQFDALRRFKAPGGRPEYPEALRAIGMTSSSCRLIRTWMAV